MANPTTLPGDLIVPGTLRVSGSITPTKARTDILSQYELQPFLIPITSWRIHDAMQTNLPGTSSGNDLAVVSGTWATDPPTLQTADLSAAGATTNYARCQIALPWDYEVGQTVKLRFHAGMVTTVSDGTATLDVECYEADGELGLSADLCTTAAMTINSLTFADIDFTITATALSPGDMLDIRIALTVTDTVTGTAVIGCVGKAQLLCDVR